jgi:hypothetical protein
MTQSDCGHYRVLVQAQSAIVRKEEFASYVTALSYFLQQAEAFAVEGMAVYFKEKEGRKWITRFTTVINGSKAKAEFGMTWLKAQAEKRNDGVGNTFVHHEPHR